MLKEFKAFVMRGNVLDLAVAVILGGAFGKIVASLVEDVLMPPLGLVLGKVDFSNLFVDLSGAGHPTLAAATAAGAPTLRYGLFLGAVVNFLVVALAIFVVVKQAHRFSEPPPAPVVSDRECPFCLSRVPLKAVKCAHCTSALAAP
jgi:large conductance mechanosensitive channel